MKPKLALLAFIMASISSAMAAAERPVTVNIIRTTEQKADAEKEKASATWGTR